MTFKRYVTIVEIGELLIDFDQALAAPYIRVSATGVRQDVCPSEHV